jgi:Sulfotransferase family
VAGSPFAAHNTLAIMPEASVGIVFIGGYARTGSTLLDRILGGIPGFASFGEMRHVWDRSFRGNQLCGCGVPFHECPFWTEVAREAFGGFDRAHADAVSRTKRSVDAFWNIPRIATSARGTAYGRRLEVYREAVGRLYRAMQRVSGARFLVDSTKDPQHAFVLKGITGFDVRFVHLIRDSRPVAYSWRREVRRPEIHWRELNMPRYSIVRSALAWDLANLAAETTPRMGFPYVRVRYEDLVADARCEVERIVSALSLRPADLSHVQPDRVHLGQAHTTAGNPVRFQDGWVGLHADDEWRTRMGQTERAAVTALTMPLLRRYRYAGSREGGAPGGRRP